MKFPIYGKNNPNVPNHQSETQKSLCFPLMFMKSGKFYRGRTPTAREVSGFPKPVALDPGLSTSQSHPSHPLETWLESMAKMTPHLMVIFIFFMGKYNWYYLVNQWIYSKFMNGLARPKQLGDEPLAFQTARINNSTRPMRRGENTMIKNDTFRLECVVFFFAPEIGSCAIALFLGSDYSPIFLHRSFICVVSRRPFVAVRQYACIYIYHRCIIMYITYINYMILHIFI